MTNIGIDFDGCVAYGADVKIAFAKAQWGVNLAVEQTAEEVSPLGPEKYRQMMDEIGSRRMLHYSLAPGCKEVLAMLMQAGHQVHVVTSRSDVELYTADVFAEAHGLWLSGMANTNRASKRSICERLGLSVFLDDSLGKLEQLVGMNIALYFMQQEWNKHDWQEASALERQGVIVAVRNWQEFYERLQPLLARQE